MCDIEGRRSEKGQIWLETLMTNQKAKKDNAVFSVFSKFKSNFVDWDVVIANTQSQEKGVSEREREWERERERNIGEKKERVNKHRCLDSRCRKQKARKLTKVELAEMSKFNMKKTDQSES